MIYKIVEISTDKMSGHTYILVHFWRISADQITGKSPERTNDFLMQLRPTEVRVVTNADGWLKRMDGVFIDPAMLDLDKPQPEWERETVDRDLLVEIKANIEAYWERAEAKGYPSGHSNPHIERDNSDPYGVLARADVLALRSAIIKRDVT